MESGSLQPGTVSPPPCPSLCCHNFNEHARTQLKSKQIYYAPFEQRINFNPCAMAWTEGGLQPSHGWPRLTYLSDPKAAGGPTRIPNLRLRKRRRHCPGKRPVIDRLDSTRLDGGCVQLAACVIYKQRHIWQTFTGPRNLSRWKLRKTI